VRAPDSVLAPFINPTALSPISLLGDWRIVGNIFTARAVGRFSALACGVMPDECLIETTLRCQPGLLGCGMLLRASDDLERYYMVRLEPAGNRLVIDRWPRSGDQPFMLERPLAIRPGQPITLRLLVSGSNLVVYANDKIALSCRIYDHRQGNLGLFVTEGEATFLGVTIKTR